MNFNVGRIGGFSDSGGHPIGAPPAEFKQQLISAGIPEDVIAQGKQAVEVYAQENGITLPPPPQPPQKPQGQSIFEQQMNQLKGNGPQGAPPSGPPTEVVSALRAGGATEAEIAGITGPADAEALAAKYGVSLPAPPAPPSGAQNIFNAK